MRVGESQEVMVASTGTTNSARAGLNVLRSGGNAIDAVLATLIAHIVNTAGAAVSFGGIMSIVYFEKKTGKVYSMNAPFKVPFQETDPETIQYNGRSAFVPGFFAGVQAAHDRFGEIEFKELFSAGIELAEEGFFLPPWLIESINTYSNTLSAYSETKSIFF